nr:hypothetical protein [uncultured Tyzzerella sp.]
MRYIKTNYYGTKDNILKYVMAFMFLGSILGSTFFCFISTDSIKKLDLFINNIDNNMSIINFIEVALKDIKYIIFIWFLAFIYLGELFIYLIVFCKGFFISFTNCIFFGKYYFNLLNIDYFYYILENSINIILIFCICYQAIKYCRNRTKNTQIDTKKYIKTLIICIIINISLLILFYYV